MGWNHRVIRHRKGATNGTVEWFQIHEVYYDEAGKPNGVTGRAVEPYGETLDELRRDLTLFAAALDKPVLDMALFDAQEAAKGEG